MHDEPWLDDSYRLKEAEIDRIGMPLLGCGLANGEWSVVKAIIEANSCNFKPVVYLIDGVIPG